MDSEQPDHLDASGEQHGVSVETAARELSPQVLSIMTTEHYNLQSGRAMTVSDANGRASLFLGTVSTSLIALAFVGQISHSGAGLGPAFFVFALVLLPSLTFLGVVTFERVLQSGSEDIVYALGINRIRHLYLECAPEMRPYFILSEHDDPGSVISSSAMSPGWWQLFLSMAGMVAVITSVLVGAFIALLLVATLSLGLGGAILGGVATFLVSVALLQRYQWRKWGRVVTSVGARFPSEA